jgi:hypothetical protein
MACEELYASTYDLGDGGDWARAVAHAIWHRPRDVDRWDDDSGVEQARGGALGWLYELWMGDGDRGRERCFKMKRF